jgi:hypothetical protein
MNDGTIVRSDSWLLLSLILATERQPAAGVRDLIAVADYIDHSIITREELETGFARLIGAGHALQVPGGFAVSPAVREFWQGLAPKNQRPHKARPLIAAMLGVASGLSGSLPVTSAERYVSSADYAAAREDYLRGS